MFVSALSSPDALIIQVSSANDRPAGEDAEGRNETLPLDMSCTLTHLRQPCSRSRPAGFVLWSLKITLHCGATLVAELPAYAAVMAA